jgi:hypothetical protein
MGKTSTSSYGSPLDALTGLAPLKSFDHRIFEGDDKMPQNVCNLVLTMSLIFNDIKDHLTIHLLQEDHKPKGEFKLEPTWGAYTGIKVHIIRQHLAIVHAVLEFIRLNKENINHPSFKNLIHQLRPDLQNGWSILVSISLGKSAKGNFAKCLARIRNKVAFHYDAEELYKGYKQHFLSSSF